MAEFLEDDSSRLRLGERSRAALAAPLGRQLLERGLLTEEQLEAALAEQRSGGGRLGEIVLAHGWVRPLDLYPLLAEQLGLPFVNLLVEPPDPELFDATRRQEYVEWQYLPWRFRRGRLWLATSDPCEETFARLTADYGEGIELVVTSRFDLLWSLDRLARAPLLADSILALWERSPESSARAVVTRRQVAALYAAVTLTLLGLALWPRATLVALNGAAAVFLTASFALRWLMLWKGSAARLQQKVTAEEVAALDECSLPVYTLLVPLYREPRVVPALAAALRRLDYPRQKLDIKLILEEDDEETIAAAKAAGLEANVELIRVPASLPRTKPKACNYALNFARGELVTIYDAEDLPEPDQLKKAVIAFRKAPASTACIQARLNYFNFGENWLTRLFTLEYSLWFDWYLPGLEALGIPIPLGGTSNHFPTRLLREVRAWDPFNVTEDADLGVRFSQRGLRVGVLNSTTFEEANTRVWNWIRQRSRWIKGYMQTYLVHMRHPIAFYRRIGPAGFWGFQFFIGGSFLSPLLVPILAAIYAIWLISGTHLFDPLFPPLVLYLSLVSLLLGNGYLMHFHMLAGLDRARGSLALWALTLPAYYALMSAAAWKALFDLIRRPHHWEKTEHGLSSFQCDVARLGKSLR